jgi:hypothetical protein
MTHDAARSRIVASDRPPAEIAGTGDAHRDRG